MFFSDGQGQLTSQSMVGSMVVFQAHPRLYSCLVTGKNEDDAIKNEGARVFATL